MNAKGDGYDVLPELKYTTNIDDLVGNFLREYPDYVEYTESIKKYFLSLIKTSQYDTQYK